MIPNALKPTPIKAINIVAISYERRPAFVVISGIAVSNCIVF